MLKNVNTETKTMITVCNDCSTENNTDLSNTVVGKNILGGYGGFKVACTSPDCDRVEVFNLDIPVTAEEEQSTHMPQAETKQREQVRKLIKLIREDYAK